MRVAVTGGTGFIGGRVVAQLRAAGHEVVCVARRPDAASGLRALGATVVPGDVLDPASLDRAFAGVEAVFHLAATYVVGHGKAAGDRMIADNIASTRLVFERALAAGARRVVYTSSCTVYVDTQGEVVDETWRWTGSTFPTAYVESKHRAHREVLEPMVAAGAPIVTLMPGAVLGPGDPSLFNLLFRWLARGYPIPIGASRWAMVGVDDCARAHLLALDRGTDGHCYNVVAENLSLGTAVRRAAEVSGLPARLVPLRDWMIAAALPPTRLAERILPIPPSLSSESLGGQRSTFSQTLSGDKATRELGFEPDSLDAVFREIVAWELKRRKDVAA